MIGLRNRLLTLEVIDSAALLIKPERSRQGPDFLRIIAGQLTIEGIDHFHYADVAPQLLLAGGLIVNALFDKHVFRKSPAITVVVTVRDRHIFQYSNRRNRCSFDNTVMKLDAKLPRKLIVLWILGEPSFEIDSDLVDKFRLGPVLLIEKCMRHADH